MPRRRGGQLPEGHLHPQSVVLGIPVAVLGLLYFAAMVAVTLPWAPGAASLGWVGPAWPARLPVPSSVVYLIYAELFLVNAICLWCTAVHVITLALFAVVVFRTVDDG